MSSISESGDPTPATDVPVGPAEVTPGDVDRGDLVDVSWWRNVLERAVRQALQVAAPILAAVVASGNGLDAKATIGAIVVAVALTVLKAVAGVRLDANASKVAQLVDRAGSALAVALLAFLPIDWADWASVDWSKALTAAVAAAVLAVVQFYAGPPRFAIPGKQDYARAA
jgi:hypothetical protein